MIFFLVFALNIPAYKNKTFRDISFTLANFGLFAATVACEKGRISYESYRDSLNAFIAYNFYLWRCY